MQQRVLVKTFPTFELAHEARISLLIENPDNTYQIRKGLKSFRLVHRFKINELRAKENPNAKVRGKYKRRSKRTQIL